MGRDVMVDVTMVAPDKEEIGADGVDDDAAPSGWLCSSAQTMDCGRSDFAGDLATPSGEDPRPRRRRKKAPRDGFVDLFADPRKEPRTTRKELRAAIREEIGRAVARHCTCDRRTG